MLKSGSNYIKQWVKIGNLGPQITQITQIFKSGLEQQLKGRYFRRFRRLMNREQRSCSLLQESEQPSRDAGTSAVAPGTALPPTSM